MYFAMTKASAGSPGRVGAVRAVEPGAEAVAELVGLLAAATCRASASGVNGTHLTDARGMRGGRALGSNCHVGRIARGREKFRGKRPRRISRCLQHSGQITYPGRLL